MKMKMESSALLVTLEVTVKFLFLRKLFMNFFPSSHRGQMGNFTKFDNYYSIKNYFAILIVANKKHRSSEPTKFSR